MTGTGWTRRSVVAACAASGAAVAGIGGVAGQERERTDGGSGEPRRAWRLGVSDDGIVDPVAHDGTVYVADGGGTLFAFDPASGSTEWTRQFDGRVVTNGLAAADEGLAVATADGTLHRLAHDGSDGWRRGVGGTPTGVALGDGTVHVAATGDGYAAAVDVGSGALQWENDGIDGQSDEVAGAPAVTADGVVLPTAGGLSVLGGEDGTRRQRVEWGSVPAVAEPVVDGDFAYLAGRDGEILKVDHTSGVTIWSRDHAAGEHAGTVAAVDGDRVYYGADRVYALETATGDVDWRSGPRPASVGLALTDGTLYVPGVAGGDPTLRAFEAATGLIEWQVDLGYEYDPSSGDAVRFSTPVVADGHVIYQASAPSYPRIEAYTTRPETTATPADGPTASPTDGPTATDRPETAANASGAAPETDVADGTPTAASETPTVETPTATPGTGPQSTATPTAEPTATPAPTPGRGLFARGDGGVQFGDGSPSTTLLSLAFTVVGTLGTLVQLRGDN